LKFINQSRLKVQRALRYIAILNVKKAVTIYRQYRNLSIKRIKLHIFNLLHNSSIILSYLDVHRKNGFAEIKTLKI